MSPPRRARPYVMRGRPQPTAARPTSVDRPVPSIVEGLRAELHALKRAQMLLSERIRACERYRPRKALELARAECEEGSQSLNVARGRLEDAHAHCLQLRVQLNNSVLEMERQRVKMVTDVEGFAAQLRAEFARLLKSGRQDTQRRAAPPRHKSPKKRSSRSRSGSPAKRNK